MYPTDVLDHINRKRQNTWPSEMLVLGALPLQFRCAQHILSVSTLMTDGEGRWLLQPDPRLLLLRMVLHRSRRCLKSSSLFGASWRPETTLVGTQVRLAVGVHMSTCEGILSTVVENTKRILYCSVYVFRSLIALVFKCDVMHPSHRLLASSRARPFITHARHAHKQPPEDHLVATHTIVLASHL
jgi:hypothetical protein